ncbi:RDD family protein [Ornithinimicrobium sufpigmenti]|uniref:RDD family protein n=1 Tax=Ornithinimicrobium sufpigmenti TaxID=2508882 RepID=UPI001EDE9F6D|nr:MULTISPECIES: RDD family protein [unclassified Ornithinimicrobium]
MDALESYQGERLGLPREGPGSVGSFLRRLVALVVDWSLCQLIATGLLGMQWGQVSGTEAFVPLGLFFVLNLVLVTTLGTTIGHRLLGIRVVSVDAVGGVDGDGRQAPPPGRSLARAALLCLFVPAVIMDADGRGLHDKAARTVVVRMR